MKERLRRKALEKIAQSVVGYISPEYNPSTALPVNPIYQKGVRDVEENPNFVNQFVRGLGDDLRENGLQNIGTGVNSFVNGVGQGFAGTPGALGFLGTTLGKYLLPKALGGTSGWGLQALGDASQAGTAVNDWINSVGPEGYTLGDAVDYMEDRQSRNMGNYMERNGIDPSNLSGPLEHMSVLGQNIANTAGSFIGFDKGTKTLARGAKALSKGTKALTRGAKTLSKGEKTVGRVANVLSKGEKYVDGRIGKSLAVGFAAREALSRMPSQETPQPQTQAPYQPVPQVDYSKVKSYQGDFSRDPSKGIRRWDDRQPYFN